MKTLKQLFTFCIVFLAFQCRADNKSIPFTLDDRDRIIRTEQKLEALDEKLDVKMDAIRNEFNAKIDGKVDGLRSEMNARFEQLFNFLWAMIGIFTTMMVSVFGFAFWDRRLSLAPR